MAKKLRILIVVFLFKLFFYSISEGRNILKDILKVYTTYEEVNMLLWLAGDVKAEKRFGEELKWFVNLTNKQVKDPEIKRWVEGIFDRVKAHFRDRGMDYNITILQGNDINAFAMPGGNIYIYKGMLDFVGSDDELAAVLAHELAHAERRHSLKKLRTSVAFQLLLEKAVKNKRDRETWGQVFMALTMLQFSREDEREADELGQQRMALAGFDPAAQVVLWEKFVQRFGKGDKGLLQYLNTHPPSIERVENARKNLAKMGRPETKDFTLSFNILSDEEENLLQNGSFETDLSKKGFPDSWESKEGKVTVDTSRAFTGKVSLLLRPDSAIRPVRVVSEMIPLHDNKKLIMEGKMIAENPSGNFAIGAEIIDSKKRLRGYIWPKFTFEDTYAGWKKFTGAFERGNDKTHQIPPEASYIRIILQNGPVAKGAIWFDDLKIQRSNYKRPENLLENGSFEIADDKGLPIGISGTHGFFLRDLDKAKTGYASLRLNHNPSGETAITFKPIPLAMLKEGSSFQMSFRFMGSHEISGGIKILFQDANGKILPPKLVEKTFTAKPNLWQANGIKFTLNIPSEIRSSAKYIIVQTFGNIPQNAHLWLDGFVIRPEN